jgi:hypothetical protein
MSDFSAFRPEADRQKATHNSRRSLPAKCPLRRIGDQSLNGGDGRNPAINEIVRNLSSPIMLAMVPGFVLGWWKLACATG